ncbi:MAG: monovalent cation/H(+) antiporter subunit G [Rhizobiaceae bacterium]
MELIIEAASWLLIGGGSLFILIGAVGLLRLPDLYTRMHAASVIETLGALLLLSGFVLQTGFTLNTIKLLFLMLLLFFTGPVVAHALAQAALHEDIEPVLSDDRREERTALLDARDGTGGDGEQA